MVSGSAAAKHAVAAASDKEQPQDVLQMEEWDMDCFHAAYDALGNQTASSNTTAMVAGGRGGNQGNGTANLQMGIQWAKKLQALIITTAVSLVTRNAITRLRHFRYAYITCTTSSPTTSSSFSTSAGPAAERNPENPQDNTSNSGRTNGNGNNNNMAEQYHVLAKPLALTRLAHYLMDMHRANGKWVGEKGVRPLVLLAEQPATGTYLVVGYEMAERAGQLPANKFGQYFGYVAASFGATNHHPNGEEPDQPAKAVARLESFDAHVVEVASTHVQHFLEQLHYIMDSM